MTDTENNNEKDERLISFIERIERLEEEKKGISDDIKEVYDEASANYDTKTIKQIIKLRKLDENEREESEFLLDEYKRLTGL